MDLEPLIRSYAKSFITSADLTALVTALVGSLAALWLGKRITTYAVGKGFSLSWGVLKWLFTSRPLGDVAAEILRAMEYQVCRTHGTALHVGEIVSVYPPAKTHPGAIYVRGDNQYPRLRRHERKCLFRQADKIKATLSKQAEQFQRRRLINDLRGMTSPDQDLYYRGGLVYTETKLKETHVPSTAANLKTRCCFPGQPTPTVTASADKQPDVTWNHQPAVCTCDADEECDICRRWAVNKLAAGTRCGCCGGDGENVHCDLCRGPAADPTK